MKITIPFIHNLTLALATVAFLTNVLGCDTVESMPDDELVALDAVDSFELDMAQMESVVASMDEDPLSPEEVAGILFMREEEKLARDVYLALYDTWRDRVFERISESESRHMESVAMLIRKYDLEDPVSVDEVGVFKNALLQQLHDSLVTAGAASHKDALQVGALIEEIDIDDLQRQLDDVVDNADVLLVYENLLRGSHNHLRAFNRRLASFQVTYEPQVLSEDIFAAIIASGTERGRKGGQQSGRRYRGGRGSDG